MSSHKVLALSLAALLGGCVSQPIENQTIVNDSYAQNQNYNSGYDPYADNRSNNGYNQSYARYADQSDQYGPEVSFNYFHDRLAPYGNWRSHPRWGFVWRPDRVGADFRPYLNGYWSNTQEYGWMWVSYDPWGELPYRYGRWVFDPRDGWLWVPGYVWGPSWVVWRSGGGNIGWFPMPPDDYYGNGAYRGNFDNAYGYRDWYGPTFSNDSFFSLWVFVDETHFGDRNFRNYAARPRDHRRIIDQTRDTTNYVTINNYIVNRSVDANRLERTTNRRFAPVPARDVIGRDAFVAPVNRGRLIERRERAEHPIPTNLQPAAPYVDPNARNPNGRQDADQGGQRDFLGRQRGDRGQPTDRVMPGPVVEQPRVETPPQFDRQQGQGFPGRGNRDERNDRFSRTPQVEQTPATPETQPQFNGQPGRGLGRAFREQPANGGGQPNVQAAPVAPTVEAPRNEPPGRGFARPFREPPANEQPAPVVQAPQAPAVEGPARNVPPGNGFGRAFREPPANVQPVPAVQAPAAPAVEAPVQNAVQPGRGLGRGPRVESSATPSQSAAQTDSGTDTSPAPQVPERRRLPSGLMRH